MAQDIADDRWRLHRGRAIKKNRFSLGIDTTDSNPNIRPEALAALQRPSLLRIVAPNLSRGLCRLVRTRSPRRRLHKFPDMRSLQIGNRLYPNMSYLSAGPLQKALRIRQVGSMVETQVHPFGINRDVDASAARPAGKGVA